MLKYLILCLVTFSVNADYVPNRYRNIGIFTDINNNEVIVIRTEKGLDMYSTKQIVSNHKYLDTTILSDADFNGLKQEFNLGVN